MLLCGEPLDRDNGDVVMVVGVELLVVFTCSSPGGATPSGGAAVTARRRVVPVVLEISDCVVTFDVSFWVTNDLVVVLEVDTAVDEVTDTSGTGLGCLGDEGCGLVDVVLLLCSPEVVFVPCCSSPWSSLDCGVVLLVVYSDGKLGGGLVIVLTVDEDCVVLVVRTSGGCVVVLLAVSDMRSGVVVC